MIESVKLAMLEAENLQLRKLLWLNHGCNITALYGDDTLGSGHDGWFWVAGWDSDVPYKNTCDAPCATVEEAKAQAMAYVKSHLGGGK